ncbi:MAG: KGK domain-containing protein [Waterburya sp.]
MDNIDRIINDNEVLSINNREDNVLISHHTYTSEEFLHILGKHIDRNKKDKWIVEGVPCKLLSPNQSWQKGKVKICLQFIPDQPESILDDIRLNNQ